MGVFCSQYCSHRTKTGYEHPSPLTLRQLSHVCFCSVCILCHLDMCHACIKTWQRGSCTYVPECNRPGIKPFVLKQSEYLISSDSLIGKVCTFHIFQWLFCNIKKVNTVCFSISEEICYLHYELGVQLHCIRDASLVVANRKGGIPQRGKLWVVAWSNTRFWCIHNSISENPMHVLVGMCDSDNPFSWAHENLPAVQGRTAVRLWYSDSARGPTAVGFYRSQPCLWVCSG